MACKIDSFHCCGRIFNPCCHKGRKCDFMNTKSMAKSAMIGLIIILLSFGAVSNLVAQSLSASTDEADVLRCRLSVMQRAITKIPFTGTSLGGLHCSTLRKNVGTKGRTSKDLVMKDVSDLTVNCWTMFGEGTLKSLRGEEDGFWKGVWSKLNILNWNSDKAFCFVCYDITVKKIADDDSISEGNLLSFYDNTFYSSELKATESSCNNGEDDDLDGKIDCQEGNEDDECYCSDPKCVADPKECAKYDQTCRMNGASCRTSCLSNEIKMTGDNWQCNTNEICCENKNDIYTYNDYLQYQSGMGGTLVTLHPEGKLFSIEQGKKYAVAYVEPFKSSQASFIAIGDFQSFVNSGCIQK